MQIDEDKVKIRAHQIWEEEGRPHGRDHDHWLQAEREIGGNTDEPARKAQPFDEIGSQETESATDGLDAETSPLTRTPSEPDADASSSPGRLGRFGR